MFNKHNFTKNKFNIDLILNYENLYKKKLSIKHIKLLNDCNIFIYQPMNKNYDFSEYDISIVKNFLNKNCKIIKVNYYRFRGFWLDCDYIPHKIYNKYTFHENFGLYNKIKNIENFNNKNEIIDFIDNLKINKEKIKNYFNNELEKLKILDKSFDVKMYNFFINNYKNTLLFHDPFHPTNTFFYEIFRQLIKIICNYNLPEKDIKFIIDLNNRELTHFTVSVLPIIKKELDLNFCDNYICFYENIHPRKFKLNIYYYYFIRLSQDNFKKFLLENNNEN